MSKQQRSSRAPRRGMVRRGFLSGAGLLLGGAAIAAGSRVATDLPSGSLPAAKPENDAENDAGRPTEHRRTYYEKARF